MTDAPLTATCPSCGACVVLPETTCCGDAVTCPECGAAGRVWVRLEMPDDAADSERVAERLTRYVGER